MYKDREELLTQDEYIAMVDPEHVGFWYLSGPMRGIDEFNFPAFQTASSRLRNVESLNVYSPADFDLRRGFDPKVSLEDQFFDYSSSLLADLEAIRVSLGVVVLPGWGDSPGARTEVEYAKAIGLPVRLYRENGEVALGPLVPSPRFEEASSAELAPGRMVEVDEVFENLADQGVENNEEYVKKLEEEVRVTSETGGMKGQKNIQFSGIDPRALNEVGKVVAYGAAKYPNTHNYRAGFPYSLSYDALTRHLHAYWSGEDVDPEGGFLHLGAVCWHALALISFSFDHPEYDDRYKG